MERMRRGQHRRVRMSDQCSREKPGEGIIPEVR
jgi:hypothetical protein